MEENNEPVNMKRGQNETDNKGWKWRKREGIKRNLRDLPRQSYAECEDDCDEFDQSKKSKHGLNCLLAALNHDVIRPLRKTELQPISEQGLGSCAGEQRPPGRERKPPISELAVSGDTVPSSPGPSAIQVRSTGSINSRNRLYSVNKYNTEQIKESATNRAVDRIQGGEKANGESCNAQYTRNKRRKSCYKPGYIMRAMLFLLFIIGSTGGTGIDKDWKETSLLAEGFDCSVPTNLQSYSIPERCFIPALKPAEKIELPSKPGFVITSEDVHEISGAVCSATISRFRGYCGAYSHWKFMDVLEAEVSREVSVEECLKAYMQHTFEASDGKLLRVEPGESVLYQYVEDGFITVLGYNTFCKGVKLQLHHSQIADQFLVLTQIRFTLDKEVFLRSKKGKMLAKQSRKSVPDECFWQEQGCIDGSLAYIFDKGTLSCPFKRVRAVQLLQDDDSKLLIDAQLGLLFNTTETRKLDVEGCPRLNLTYTTYDGIIFTMDMEAKDLALVKGLNIHEANSLGPTLEFFHHNNHNLVQSLIRRQLEGDCEAWMRISNLRDHPHPTLKQRGLFTRRVGSIIHEYSCKNIQTPMVELDHCLTGIPVLLRGELHMIDTDSRIITKHLETQPCEQGFPVMFKTAGDTPIWVQISRGILQVKDP